MMMFLFRLIMAVVSDYNRGTDAVEGQATTDIVSDPRALMLLPSMCEGFFMLRKN